MAATLDGFAWLGAGCDRLWRRVATGACFAIFALCALLVGVVIGPLIRLCSATRPRAQYRVRRVVRLTCRGFIGLLRGLGLIDYRIVHLQRLHQPGRLLLANHPSLIDALFLLAFTPDAGCIVKGRLTSHPITRGAIRAAGFIANHEPRAMIAAAREALDNGQPLIVFPEGTRTTPGEPIRLRRGGVAIAMASGAWITPVRIRCQPSTLIKGEPWYRVPPRKPCFVFEVGKRIRAVGDALPEGHRASGELTRRLEAYFNQPTMDEGAVHGERVGT